jgi:orotate phosphoribosyltransferase
LSTSLVDLVAKSLVQAGGFLIWPEKTDEGVLQPYVLDLTVILSDPKVFDRVAGKMVEVVREEVGFEKFNSVLGVPLAGIPYASYVSIKTGKPMLLLREGKAKSVEGLFKIGDKVLIVDDFVSTGRQVSKAVDKIVLEGGVVEDTMVIVCQSKKAAEKLRKKGVELHYVFEFRDLVESLRKLDALTESEYEALISTS